MESQIPLWVLVIFQNMFATIEQNPQLNPNGRLQFCEGENQNFTCTPTEPEGTSFWTFRGLSGVSDQTTVSAFGLNITGIRFSSPDVDPAANPSVLTILNLVPEDTGATVQCLNSKLDSSTLAEILVGPPSCSSIFPKVTVSSPDVLRVSWNVSTCTVKPTEYKVTWSEIENEGIVSSSMSINKTFYSINVTTCKDNAINISLYNKCGTRDLKPIRTDFLSQGGMVLTVKNESLCPRGNYHFMIEFTDILVNECFSMFGINLTYNVTSERGVAIATGSEVYRERDVLYSTSLFVLPVGNNYITVSTQGKGFEETQPIPRLNNILQVDLKVEDKLYTVTCSSSCNIDILSQHFQCRAYPFNNTEWSVTENFTNGRAKINLTIENDNQPIQMIIVELVTDNIVTQMKVITVKGDESDGESAIQALFPGVIAGAVLAGLVLLSIIATVVSVVLNLAYKKWSKVSVKEQDNAAYEEVNENLQNVKMEANPAYGVISSM